MRPKSVAIFLLLAGGGPALFAASGFLPERQDRQHAIGELAYHDHPPLEPLPSTLDAAQFVDNHAAFLTYKLAAKLKDTLYQVPCYCPCRRGLGHESLLDCYTSKHGVRCPMCQKEVLFCYLQNKKGKTPAEIRKDMAKGKASKLDLNKTVNHLYAQILNEKK